MNGWTKVGEVLKCAACSAVVANAEESSAKTPEKASSEAMERLRGFLGADTLEKPKVNLSDSDKRFCKDCVHLVRHPFVLRCDLDNHTVDSMDDCPKFERAPDSGK